MVRKIKLGKIEISFSNKWLYTLIAIAMIILLGVVVYGYASSSTGAGHELNELKPCADSQILQTDGNGWSCVDASSVGTDTDTNTYCSASGNTISCPDGTSLTDTNTNTWRPAISCSCGTCWATKTSGSCSCQYNELCTPAGWKRTDLGCKYTCPRCFVSGTKVRMANGELKNIEKVEIGDKVKGRDNTINTMIGYEKSIVGSRSTYTINDEVEFTGDHPFLTKDGWKVADLELFQAFPRELEEESGQLSIGDILLTENGEVEIISLEVSQKRLFGEIVYDLKLDNDRTYIANGFIVHNY